MQNIEDKILSLIDIGVALTSEKDLQVLLDLILKKAMEMSRADGASIYLIENLKKNESPKQMRFLKSATRSKGSEIKDKVLALNHRSIAGFVATTGESLVIEDCYDIPKEAPYEFNQQFDQDNNYRSKSMLVLPLKNANQQILGVLQLINKLPDSMWTKAQRSHFDEKQIASFNQEDLRLTQALASQAAVALSNARLTEEINQLFESFVKASVMAIESRDPTTSGHSDRVALMTVDLAKVVDGFGSGVFKNVQFSDQQIREIRYASLLHDFGKIGVRENILMKEKKLFAHELEGILLRLEMARLTQENHAWKSITNKIVDEIECGCDRHKPREILTTSAEHIKEFSFSIMQLRQKILQANEPHILAGDFDINNLMKEIDNMSQVIGQDILSEDMRMRLSIPKGTLSFEEREEIESHVTHTFDFLSAIAWTEDLSRVPNIAHSHHEKLDGSGYPRRVKADDIPLQSRMMTIADIYDALTAMDRPYKKAVPVDKALDILQMEAKAGKLDQDLLRIFIEAEIYIINSSNSVNKKIA